MNGIRHSSCVGFTIGLDFPVVLVRFAGRDSRHVNRRLLVSYSPPVSAHPSAVPGWAVSVVEAEIDE